MGRFTGMRSVNEVGWALCRTPEGRLLSGPLAEGTPMSVNIPVGCPGGSRLAGLFHTHPAGVAFPSDTDIRSAKAVGAGSLCIDADGQLACYRTADL